MKLRGLGLGAVLVGAIMLTAPSAALAQEGTSQPSAKATAKVGNINMVSGPTTSGRNDGDWTTIMRQTIKTSKQKDLIMGVSLEIGLYTETTVRSKGGTKDTSTSEASVQVQVTVDGRTVEPGAVTFNRRMQQLSATLQGLIDGALSVDQTTGQIIIDETLLTPEEVSLIQDTMSAHAFNFILADVGTGVHTVEVQARVSLAADAQAGAAVAKATVGKGCVTVQEVRMIKNEDIILD